MKFLKRLVNDKPFRYLVGFWICIALTPLSVTIWRSSVPWLNFLSITALTLSVWNMREASLPIEEPGGDKEE